MPTEERPWTQRDSAREILQFMEKHELLDEEMGEIICRLGELMLNVREINLDTSHFWKNFLQPASNYGIDHIRRIANGD